MSIASRITAIYAAVGSLWILFSDRIVALLVRDAAVVTELQSAKGILYILTTAALLYFLIRHYFRALQASKNSLEQSYDATLRGWAHALELRDHNTNVHTQRVIETTLQLARILGIQEPQLTHIRRGVLLHDIGKMGIPDSILLKPGALTEQEWQVMKQHPVYARAMLERVPYLQPALEIPYAHHEKWDGSGYPRGLTRDEIPFAARIFSVVDVWDALTSDRPYRAAWSAEQARAFIHTQAGKQFDPLVANTFLGMIAEPHATKTAH